VSKEVRGVETLAGWHRIDDVKYINSQVTVNMIFHSDRLAHLRWDPILHHASILSNTAAPT
jgi:hypothetical protein